jgi:hypothetical protein
MVLDLVAVASGQQIDVESESDSFERIAACD